MKREREQTLTNVGNSPKKGQEIHGSEKRVNVYSATSGSKITFAFNLAANPDETIAAFLKWKKQWNAFLIVYLHSQVHPENRHIDIVSDFQNVKKARHALRSLNLEFIKDTAQEISVLIALNQCDSFDCHLSLGESDLQEIPSFLKSIRSYDKLILGNYKVMQASLKHAESVLEDLSVNPTYAESIEMLKDLEENIVPAFNDYLNSIVRYPEAIDRKIKALKSTPLKPRFAAILEDRSQSMVQLLDNIRARRSIVATFVDEIKAEMQRAREAADNLVEFNSVEFVAESIPSNTTPSNF